MGVVYLGGSGNICEEETRWMNHPMLGFDYSVCEVIYKSLEISKELEQLFEVVGDNEKRSVGQFALSFYSHLDVSHSETRGKLNVRIKLNKKRFFSEVENSTTHSFRTRARKNLPWFKTLIDPTVADPIVDLLIDTETFTVASRNLINISQRKRRGVFEHLVERSESGICQNLADRLAKAGG